MASPASSKMTSVATNAARQFLPFVNETGSPYHAVAAVKKMLLQANFEELSEANLPWRLQKGGKYFLTKLGTTVCAFVVGGQFHTADPTTKPAAKGGGFVICGAHTDSPCLRLRPNTKVTGTKEHVQVGVQTYGGGLWHTWFDRPLGLAGKVVLSRNKTPAQLEEKLVRIDRPVLLVPNLAIHLQTADERKAFSINTETNLQPVLCMTSAVPTSGLVLCEPVPGAAAPAAAPMQGAKQHSEELLTLLHEEMGVSNAEAKIVDLDLCLFDAEPSRLIGAREDFIFSGRIDNLISVWAQYDALVRFAQSPEAATYSDIAVACAFDHEEVGSESTAGADSGCLQQWLQQILGEVLDSTTTSAKPGSPKTTGILKNNDAMTVQFPPRAGQPGSSCIPYQSAWLATVSRSILFSIDAAHAYHPNYAAKHQSEHRPVLHQGIVIKHNANQRYATTSTTSALLRAVAAKDNIAVQDFVVRNDCPCGSTIGPMVSSNLGMRAIDLGIPQWAMHSVKETCSSIDLDHLQRFCLSAFRHFRELDNGLTIL
ncbi:unnamed protein product [Amoebophrya sp. A120]|nr:unnamed protein product [Amoebophrya sp. A120]|eukprot:GSA120T00011615001.1